MKGLFKVLPLPKLKTTLPVGNHQDTALENSSRDTVRLVKHVAFLRDREVSMVHMSSFIKASTSLKELSRHGAFPESLGHSVERLGSHSLKSARHGLGLLGDWTSLQSRPPGAGVGRFNGGTRGEAWHSKREPWDPPRLT